MVRFLEYMTPNISVELLRAVTGGEYPILTARNEISAVPELLKGRFEEFVLSPRIDAEMVAEVCRTGCIPMAHKIGDFEFLMIKLHHFRSVLHFPDLHTPRKTRSRSRGLQVAVDRDFSRCLEAVRDHYPPSERWLTPRLCTALDELHVQPRFGVSTHSIEVYDGTELVAGEIGYHMGAVYTSMSGFYLRSGSGTVQLISLARILESSGFLFWDLGMDVPYKRTLGAKLFPRAQFLGLYYRGTALTAGFPHGDLSCEELIRVRK